MNALKRLFTSSIYVPAQQLVQQYLSTLKLSTPQQLSNQYQPLLNITLTKCQKPHKILHQLLKKLNNIDNHCITLKLLTLIHNFIIERQYSRQDIQDLQQFDMHEIQDKNQDKWFNQFVRSYVTYLMKLPSQADIYAQIIKKQYNTEPKWHLMHIFRITNTVRVLFPSVTNAINVIGRYQATKHKAIKQLFLILSSQLVKVYSYIKFLCDQILRQYRAYNPKDLKCFIEILPQLQLLCDKIEDLLVTKYLKGKKIALKIEFKEQRVAQLQYYLQYQYQGKQIEKKNQDQVICKI